MDEVFQSPLGALLMFPGDPRAPVSEISGCRCRLEYKADYIGAVARWYRAEVAWWQRSLSARLWRSGPTRSRVQSKPSSKPRVP